MTKHTINFVFAILVFASFGCKKEAPVTPDPPVEFVPTYTPCYKETGEASARKLTAEWSAGAACRSYLVSGRKYWLVELTTCSNGDGSLTENLVIGRIPDDNPAQNFKIVPSAPSLPEGEATTYYSTFQQDGDVAEDLYLQDTTVTNNYVIIDRWDTANKRVEGRFFLSFQIKEPVQNAINPKKVVLHRVSFGRRFLEGINHIGNGVPQRVLGGSIYAIQNPKTPKMLLRSSMQPLSQNGEGLWEG